MPNVISYLKFVFADLRLSGNYLLMLRILLIRHGETDWNRQHRIMGREEIGLNSTGREQSRHMKEALTSVPMDALYSSPILRARETAEILCQERDLEPIYDSRLEEVGYGDWVGKTFLEIRETPGYIPYYDRLDTPVAPKGETLFQVRNRALEFLNDLKSSSNDRTIAVVSHADWIKCLLMHILDIPFKNIWRFRIDNVSVTLYEFDGRGDRIICVNQRGDFERLFISRFTF